MELEKMEEDKVYPQLITVNIMFGDHYIDIHSNTTPQKAIQKVTQDATESCFAMAPHNAINLSKDIIDAAYYSKTTRKQKKHGIRKKKTNRL